MVCNLSVNTHIGLFTLLMQIALLSMDSWVLGYIQLGQLWIATLTILPSVQIAKLVFPPVVANSDIGYFTMGANSICQSPLMQVTVTALYWLYRTAVLLISKCLKCWKCWIVMVAKPLIITVNIHSSLSVLVCRFYLLCWGYYNNIDHELIIVVRNCNQSSL